MTTVKSPQFIPWNNGISQLYQADARHIPLDDGSVHCVVTSPPYYGLRVYRSDSAAMIGLEETPDGWLDSMMTVMDEVWRVLRDDGICWVNLGDSYGHGTSAGRQRSPTDGLGDGTMDAQNAVARNGKEAGQLLGIPWRFALAMQERGWILRSDVIWAKKSPMPESLSGSRWERCRVKVTGQKGQRIQDERYETYGMPTGGRDEYDDWADCPGCDKCAANDGLVLRNGSWRSTSSHEHIFQFVKSMGYWSDGEAVKTTSLSDHPSGNGYKRDARMTYQNDDGSSRGNDQQWQVSSHANRRNVWNDIKPEPYGGQHFATFPPDLPRICIHASTSEAGVCADCGRQWARVVDRDKWRPTCTCNAATVPALVLDPFAGTGTTLLAAMRLGRRSVGTDLSEDYLQQAVKRLSGQSLPMAL